MSFLDNTRLLENLNNNNNLFFYILMCLSVMTYEQFICGLLDVFYHKVRNVIDATNRFYGGLVCLFENEIEGYVERSQKKEINNKILNEIVMKIKNVASTTPSTVLWKYNGFAEKYPRFGDTLNSVASINDFVNK